jgi:hypothetical protein
MKLLSTYSDWLNENHNPRPLRKLTELDINRKFGRNPQTGDKYETELFPMFRRLKPRIEALSKKPSLEEWFAMMQNSDNQFYSMVQADTLAQPDVRELWRDLTGQRASKMKKYNLSESAEDAVWKSEIDPEWTVIVLFSDDELYAKVAKIFDSLGIAFADMVSKTIFVDGQEVEWLAIRILENLGYGEASAILEKRYNEYYDEQSSELENTDTLEVALQDYVN